MTEAMLSRLLLLSVGPRAKWIVLALWLELSVSIILYCAEIVALLIGAPRSRRAPEIRAEAEADAAIVSSIST